MEKRLPILLLALAGIVFLLPVLTGAGPEDSNSAVNAAPPAGQDQGAPGDATPALEPEPAPQGEAWEETLLLGGPDAPVRYQAVFNSLGGSLTHLRLDGYYDQGRLQAEQKADAAHWVPLLQPVVPVFDQGDTGRAYGSLLLTTSPRAGQAFPTSPRDLHWEHEVLREGDVVRGVRFRLPSPSGLQLVKEITLATDGTYELDVVVRLDNTQGTAAGGEASFYLTPAIGVPPSSEDKFYQEPTARQGAYDGDEVDISSVEVEAQGQTLKGDFGGRNVAFSGVDNKYFAVLLRAADDRTQGSLRQTTWGRLHDSEWVREHPEDRGAGFRHVRSVQELGLSIPAPGFQSEYRYRLFAGPKSKDALGAADADLLWLRRSDLGFFDGIGRLLLNVLGFFAGIVGNWGVAIILLTLCVRGALFPLNRRSQTAMARHATKMKRVQPKLNELKEKYANNPQKQRQEQARIMQEEGAFPPLGGCLPMFLQIPVFFGLYQALRVAFDLRQKSFLWVDDLSMPDRLLPTGLDMSLPLIGSIEYFNVLPPLMVFLWILQQRLMPKPTDEQALKMQRMMMWMPIVFGVFLYNYAAGLSLYMITSSAFGIMEYTVIRRIWPLDDAEKPRKPGRFMQRLMELQEQAQEMEKQKRAMRDKQGKGKAKVRR